MLGLPWLASSMAAEPAPPGAEPHQVRVPHNISTPDPQLAYIQRIVRLALARVDKSWEVSPVDLEMAQTRSMLELVAGKSPVDLMWTVTDRQREASGLIPIRLPVDRGLMGWRLLLVRADDLPRWKSLGSLEELRQRLAGQGHDWPDTAILRANKLPVATSTGYDALFRMLLAHRFDYFPRSILEIDGELANNRHPRLAIVPDLMLLYPTAAYLFVSPRRPALAQALQLGMEAAIADGSFQRLHREQYGALLRAHPVAAHRVLHLSNPLLPAGMPLHRRELWQQPGEHS